MRCPVLATLGCLAATLGLAFVAPAQAATEIVVWHTLQGVPAATFTELTDRFNAEHKGVHVTLQYKGDATQAVDAAIAVMHTKSAPDLVQVEDDQTDRLLSVRGGVRPIFEVLPLVKSPDLSFFLPATARFMKDTRGRLLGFPLLEAVPVFLYNRDAYQKAGLDPDAPPRTWPQLQKQLLALQGGGRGVACPYTTSQESWIHIENLSTWDGETFATKDNGFSGSGALLTFNDLLHVRHIAFLESWVKSDLFKYFGALREGDAHFASGECATLTTGSDAIGGILATAKFHLGVAPLPYYDEATHTPFNTLVKGSALWAMGGKKPLEYRASAEFLAYLATPVVAAQWAQKTGSLPLTTGAYAASEASNAYARAPGLADVMKIASRAGDAELRGEHLPRLAKVRVVIDSQLEAVWAGHEAPKEALDDAVRLGNAVMREGSSPKKPASRTGSHPMSKSKKTG